MRQRFIQSFPTSKDIQSALDNKELGKPYVAFSREEQIIDWNSKEIDYTGMPLTFEIISGGTIGLISYYNTKTKYEYQINDGEIVTGQVDSNAYTNISLNAGDVIKIRGFENTQNGGLSVSPDADLVFNIYGNVASLGSTQVKLSLAGKHVISAENLVMLDPYFKYEGLFKGCTDLITAPKLPATKLASSCYSDMFSGCTSLTTAPALPATTLASNCYNGMFQGCTSLTTAPELPATTLADNCYANMFAGCTNLTQAPELPVTKLAAGCYQFMFQGCTSLTTAPELPATTLPTRCYSYMFEDCTNLTQAPELPATTLADYCYEHMFYECSKLNYIKCLATDMSASSCKYMWVYNTHATGTFVKHPNATWTTGESGIPNGWTVENAVI